MTPLRRLVLDLAPGGADRARLRAAAEIARQLGADLHGVFVEDEAVFHLAGLPFGREIRLPGHEWRPLEAAALTREFAAAAAVAERMLDETVRGLGMACAFEILRGDPGACLAALLGEADIVAVLAPADTRRRTGTYGGSAAILLLPPGYVPQDGPVAVVPGDPPGPALDLAVSCAREGGTRLLILAESEPAGAGAAARAAELGLHADDTSVARLAGSGAEDVIAALGAAGERLVVVQAADGHDHQHPLAGTLLERRHVPVLLAAGRHPGPQA